MRQQIRIMLLLLVSLFAISGCEKGTSLCSMTSDATCPSFCTASNDIDCKIQQPGPQNKCGNGKLDEGETCDDTTTSHRCPSSHDACDIARRRSSNSDDLCYQWKQTGSAKTCDLKCEVDKSVPLEANPTTPDLCCPVGADATTDIDCYNKHVLDSKIGEGCTDDDACGADGYCITEKEYPAFKGGYCSAKVTAPMKEECPTGSAPVEFLGKTLCMKTCSDPSGCRTTDYTCKQVDPNNTQTFCTASATCGDGEFDPSVETCDNTSSKSSAHCITDASTECEATRVSASDNNGRCAAYKIVGDADTCSAKCEIDTAGAAISTLTDGDRCCPAGGDITTDSDCTNPHVISIEHVGEDCTDSSKCGTDGFCITESSDSMFTKGYCTGEIKDKSRYACPAGTTAHDYNGKTYCFVDCGPSNACTRSTDKYACSPSEHVCVPSCGDGALETNLGETCDNSSPNMADHCVTDASTECEATRMSASDNNGRCAAYKIVGDANTCSAKCEIDTASPAISTLKDGDLCCPTGGDITTDNDCTNPHVISIKNVGEACTDNNKCGTDGVCITENNDPVFKGGYCTGEIKDKTKYACPAGTTAHDYNGKTYCFLDCGPSKACTRKTENYTCSTSENVCVPSCGDGALETKLGETCDDTSSTPAEQCPKNAANDCEATRKAAKTNDDRCSEYQITGSAATCSAVCEMVPGGGTKITTPKSGDGCCPAGADKRSDSDCTNKHILDIKNPGGTCKADTDCQGTTTPTDATCILESADARYKGGYCTAKLNGFIDQCPTGTKAYNYNGNYCFKTCTGASDDCGGRGSDYKCDTTSLVCIPKAECTNNQQCSDDKTCNTSNHTCEALTKKDPSKKAFHEACSKDDDCDTGAKCLIYDVNTNAGICTFDCTSNADMCPGGNVCSEIPGRDTKTKYCLTNASKAHAQCSSGLAYVEKPDGTFICYANKINAKVGVACTKDDDCGPEGKCQNQTLTGANKGGYCKGTITKQRTSCPADSKKIVGITGESCLKKCSVDTDCRHTEGYTCDSLDKVCKPPLLRTRQSQCTSGEERLAISGGKFVCAVPHTDNTTGKELGEACTSYTECKGGGTATSTSVCIQYDTQDQYNGYCSIDCSNDPNVCGADGVCEDFGNSKYFCVKKCTASGSECSSLKTNQCKDSTVKPIQKVCKY